MILTQTIDINKIDFLGIFQQILQHLLIQHYALAAHL